MNRSLLIVGVWWLDPQEVVPEVREDITSQRATVFDTIEGGGSPRGPWLEGKSRRKLPEVMGDTIWFRQHHGVV